MKFTKREKVLLYFLLCFVLVMGGLFVLVLPSMKAKDEVELEYQTAKSRLSSLQSTLIQYGDLESAITDTENQIEEVKSKFYQPILNEDVDKLLKEKLLLRNLTPLTMAISDPVPAELQIASTDTSGTTEEAVNQPTANISVITVSMTFTGDSANLANFVDDIKALEATQIGSLTYDATNVDNPITISFKLYVLG